MSVPLACWLCLYWVAQYAFELGYLKHEVNVFEAQLSMLSPQVWYVTLVKHCVGPNSCHVAAAPYILNACLQETNDMT